MKPLSHPAEPFDQRRIAIDELDTAIVGLSARINASTYQLLELIREFDERAGFLKWGLSNTAEWLHWRCDIGLSAAREKVRCARSLKELPQMTEAFAQGALSYSKVRALTRVATSDNEAALLAFAIQHCVARVEERSLHLRNVLPESTAEAKLAHDHRSLRIWRHPHRPSATISIELPLEEAELIASAIDKAAQVYDDTELSPEQTPWSALQADALVHVVRAFLTGDDDSGSNHQSKCTADAYQVVVHVDETALSGHAGKSDLPLESVKRLTCDGSLIRMTDGINGEPLNVGRKQRTVPTAIKRALWSRDKGCSFPGCTHTHYVDAHHIKHWADGGETSLDNLMLLCSKHHRMVHESGFEIRKDHEDQWYFRRPDGRAMPRLGYHSDDFLDQPIADGCEAVCEVRESPGIWRVHRPSPEGICEGAVMTA